MANGHIRVTDRGILVEKIDGAHHVSAGYHTATVENLMDAAQYLARTMRLPYSDPAKEAQRIHGVDQLDAFVRDTVTKAIREIENGTEER